MVEPATILAAISPLKVTNDKILNWEVEWRHDWSNTKLLLLFGLFFTCVLSFCWICCPWLFFYMSLISCNRNVVVRNLSLYVYKMLQLGDGLVYEVVDGSNSAFPHFYGPSRSFSPLILDAVTNAEKLCLSDDRFSCSMLH